MKFLFDNGNQNVSRHGAPDLRLDGVLAVAQELLYAQVLLDPFEEQFDLPAVLVQGRDCQWWQHEVVGQKDELLVGDRVPVANAPQVLGVVLRGIKPVEQDRLIANNSRGAVCSLRVNAPGIHVVFGACDEESAGVMHLIQTPEVEVSAIHYIERPGFDGQEVQHVDLVHLPVADVDECWDCATQVQQGMQFDGRLRSTKRCPLEKAQTQIDGRGVQGIYRVLEIEPNQIGIAVELACSSNQHSRQIRPDAPIPRFVGVRQRRPMHAVTQTHCIKLVGVGPKRRFDVAQALAPGQLRKRHHAKLFRATHAANAGVATVAIHDSPEARPGDELHDLRKKGLADVHESSPRGVPLGNYPKMKNLNSNRHQIKSTARPRQYWLLLENNPV